MAEREIYNPNTGQFELIDDDGIYETNPLQPPAGPTPTTTAPPAATAPPASTGGVTGGTGSASNSGVYVPGGHRDRNAPPPFDPPPGTTWAWDDANGWYPSTSGGGYTGGGEDYGGGAFDLGNEPIFGDWPSFAPPALPNIGRAPVLSPFSAPTMEEAEANPGYQFGKKEMLGALQNRFFGQGLGRTPNAYNAILKNANAFAEQNYGNLFNRNLDVYRQNNDNLFRTWEANKDLDFDIFDRNYKSEWDKFASGLDTTKFDRSSALQKWIAKMNAAAQMSRPVE